MKILKKLTLDFTNNDIYTFKQVGNYVLINYKEDKVLLLDHSFHQINKISLERNVYIYDVMCNYNGSECILYCPDEQLLLHCNFISSTVYAINIRKIKAVISSFYYWDKDSLVFSTYDNRFYRINTVKHTLNNVSMITVQKKFTALYILWKEAQNYSKIWQIDALKNCFIYQNEDKKEIGYVDCLSNTVTTIKTSLISYHDVIFLDDLFVFISEESLTFVKNNDVYVYVVKDPTCIFLKACLFNESKQLFLIALVSNKFDNQINTLIKYEVTFD